MDSKNRVLLSMFTQSIAITYIVGRIKLNYLNMQLRNLAQLLSLILLLIYCSNSIFAQITLPEFVSDNMVLQREKPIKIWGWASPKERITIKFKGLKLNTNADEQGHWSFQLPAQPAGGPFEILLKGKNEITIKNVLFGDVWICAGQSNMVINMERVKEKYPKEIANATISEIRNFFIPTTTNLEGPQDDLPAGKWKAVSPKEVLGMGAVTYFFARNLYDKYQIPIGIINASVGGTPIEAWISEEGLQESSILLKTIQQNKDTTYVNSLTQQSRKKAPKTEVRDKGLLEKWYDPAYAPKGWQNINIPGYWEDQGVRDLNGVVWYRREIEVPKEMTDKAVKLFMGRIVDADEIYVNGQKVGNITYQYPPRRYTIPKGGLKPGKNLIVARIINYNGKGGFVPDKPYFMTDDQQEIDLKGTWQYKVGEVFDPKSKADRFQFWAQNQPASLFNAMAAPLTGLAIKGFLWYQGESNVRNAEDYYGYLPTLIKDWRHQWKQGQLPFLYVQLANFQDATYLPVESDWAVLRDAQLNALKVPNTAMAVTIDLGEWNDIHPLNKKGVGTRLALAAQNLAYGDQNVVYSGPVFKEAIVEGNKIRIRFEHIGSGLTTSDGEPPTYLAIAGHDKRFVWANAKIEDNELVIWQEAIEQPRYVRYAWADNPFGANLINKEGLPASPFRTDYHPEYAQKRWHGKRAAVVLTYDDALNVHLDHAIPDLNQYNLKGTFYLSAAFPGSKNRIEDWKKAAQQGHELGNHTLYHPCDATKPGREWVNPVQDLSKYTTEKLMREIEMTNTFLEALDGQKDRTFAYTCGDMNTSDGSFKEDLKEVFVAARGVEGKLGKMGSIDLFNIDSYGAEGKTGAELIALVEKAKAENAFITILFHGVGGEHNLNVDRKAHQELVEYLYKNQDDLWVTTMLEAAMHIKKMQR